MAFVSLVNRANIGPGVVTPADLAVPQPTHTQLVLRLDPNAADWGNAALTFTVDCWSSPDGADFSHYCGGFSGNGNTFDKLGNPPAYAVFFPAGTQKLRSRVTLSAGLRLGLQGEWS